MKYEDKIEWLNNFSKTINKVPRDSDKYVTQIFNLKIRSNKTKRFISCDDCR